jgi:hypothetical protein
MSILSTIGIVILGIALAATFVLALAGPRE